MSARTWRRIALLVFAMAVLMALRLIGPAVPKEIRLLTGPEGTTFFENGLRYRAFLEHHGIEVVLEPTDGSIETLKRLAEAQSPSAGFVSGLWNASGHTTEAPEGLESIGTMYPQPLWVFARKGTEPGGLAGLGGQQVEAGESGSDGRLLALLLLSEAGVAGEVDFAPGNRTTPNRIEDAVRNNEVSAIFAAGEPDSVVIDRLLRTPELEVISIRRADAFAIRHPLLLAIRFPEGAQDLAANIPNRDLELLAARTQLLVSDRFPPAVADLLAQAAREIHGGKTTFSSRGEFPDPETDPVPLHPAAANFYTDGPPALQRFLPFRLAAWIDRFMAAAVAIASTAVALFSFLPALISLPFKRRIKSGYSALEAIEREASKEADPKRLLDELAKLERATATIRVPLRSLEVQWLELRQYLHDLRDRLESA